MAESPAGRNSPLLTDEDDTPDPVDFQLPQPEQSLEPETSPPAEYSEYSSPYGSYPVIDGPNYAPWIIGGIVALCVAIAIAVIAWPKPDDKTAQKEHDGKARKFRDDDDRPVAPVDKTPDGGDAAIVFGSCAFWIILVIAYAVMVILILVWIVKDARNRSVDSGAVWIIVIIFTGWLGLLIYLASRPSGTLTFCPHCGNKRLEYTSVCPHCRRATE